MKKVILAFFCLFLFNETYAQPSHLSSGEILQKLRKLNVLGNALYVAAHPDDENTRLIAYLGNERLMNTAYLSLTRGDGGQNLIGPELREGLGVIRTQELLAARGLDGGRQFFTRANDFGYSKTAAETLTIWDQEDVLSDVVWTFRKFRPDVVITRFPGDERAGHGHHTTSAIMAERAFVVAGTNEFPEQLAMVQPWQPTRLMINSGRWWDEDIENRPGVLKVDAGSYSPYLGLSYTEMAAVSRSQHKSQGFGSRSSRGESFEYLSLILGDSAVEDIFDGIDVSWNRVGAQQLEKVVEKIIEKFDASQPDLIITDLLALRRQIEQIEDPFWRNIKIKEVDHLLIDCSGLFLGAWAQDYTVVPGESVTVDLEIVNRSNAKIKLAALTYLNGDTLINQNLNNNFKLQLPISLHTKKGMTYSSPYWLNEPASLGMYKVKDQINIGLPENNPAFNVDVQLEFNNTAITYPVPVVYRWTDRVNGEMMRPVCVVPPVFLNPDNAVYVFGDGQAKTINIAIKAAKENISGLAFLELPEGWQATPANIQVDLMEKNQIKQVSFEVTPPQNEQAVNITASFKLNNEIYDQSLQTIAYDHIPYQILLPKAEVKAVSAKINSYAKTIGYIMGAGDEVPAALEQLGIKVWLMNENDITESNLQQLDAVILGVRALNTNLWLKSKKEILLNFVDSGGTVVHQYNTTRRLEWQDFAPYELNFTGRSSDSRVAEETADIRVLDEQNIVLNTPNPITAKDFEGWVQERGLYFPTSWDEHYTAVLSANDHNEEPKDGGLLVAQYGKGYFVYTGYSWFRELPAGVPGAYKLFANIISLSQSIQEQQIKSGQK